MLFRSMRRARDDDDEFDSNSIPRTPSVKEGSSGERAEEQPLEADVQEGSQFELRQCEDPSHTPTSLVVTPPTRISLQSIHEFLVSERDARLRVEALLRDERDARIRVRGHDERGAYSGEDPPPRVEFPVRGYGWAD